MTAHELTNPQRANRRTYEYLVQRCGQLMQENATLWSFVRVAAKVEDWPDWTVAQIMDGAKDLADQARALLATHPAPESEA